MHRLFLLTLLAGCSPVTYAYTPASNLPVSPKPDNCVFEVLSAPSSEDFEELGYLEHYNGGKPKTADKFKAAVAKQVCGAGGDAVVAIMDNKGELTKGTIIRFRNKRPAGSASPPPPPADTERPPM